MNYNEVKYIVFDIESVPDAKLIKKVRFQDEEISEEEAVKRYQSELLEQSGGVSDFIPVTFQYPVSICVAKVGADFSLLDIVSLDEPEFRAGEMVRLFWFGIEDIYSHASMVTFNGRGFDVPLLEFMAYRYGIQAQRHFRDKFAGRYRFGTKHIDLQDWLGNFGGTRMAGGLNLFAKILGKPGKMSTMGSEVYGLFLEGKRREINEYCIHDVLDTYFVFLRTRVLNGEITLDKEQKAVQRAKKFLEDNLERIPAFKQYLEMWGNWDPWP